MPPFIKSTPLIAFLVLLSSLFIGNSAVADEEHDHAVHGNASAQMQVTNEYCPVIPDEKVDPSISVEYKGQKVYLCCNMCRKDFLENPEAYIGNLPQFASQQNSLHEMEGNHEESASKKDGSAHNHATDHGDSESGGITKIVNYASKFHPVLVHFPIALGITALLAELLFYFTKGELFRAAGRFSIVVAALAALVAAPLGWAAAAFSNYPTLAQTLTLHRWVGTTASILLIGCAILSEISARKNNVKFYQIYIGILLVAALLTGLAGHLGATLIYGPDHFAF